MKYLIKSFILIVAFLSFNSMSAIGQEVKVAGTVHSNTGEALPGVNVVIKGGTDGTITNMDGVFELTVPNTETTLIFSFMGFESKEIVIGNQTSISIVLIESEQALEEVVVIGYGSVQKSDLTGSVSSVKAEDLNQIPSQSIDKLLQGRVAGMQVISSDGPGSGATIRIRGGSSLRGSNAPLVVVDGFPYGEAGDLKQINPSDIESIEILKDASASAIYGSRGANGVILITTKKGKKGKTEISIRSQTTVSQFTSKLNVWKDVVQMALLSNEERTNGIGVTPLYIGAEDANGVYYPSIEELETGAWPYNTDWTKEVFRGNPVSQSTTVTIRSGRERSNYSFSLNYLTDKGIYIADDYNKLNAQLNTQSEIFNNMKLTTSNVLYKGFRDNTLGTSYNRNPIFPVYDENGDYFLANVYDFYHPVALRENTISKSNSIDLASSARIDWLFLPFLSLSSQANYKYGAYTSDTYYHSKYTDWGNMNNGAAEVGNYLANQFVNENILNFNKTFGDHKLKVMLGQTYEYFQTRTSTLSAYDFVNETLQNENLSAGNEKLNNVENSKSETEMLSFLTRIDYSLFDKYLFTFTGRYDGSSKFGANNRWAFFPSGAVSWKIHNESFMQSVTFIDELKIRTSYGVSGNQEGISAYQTLSRYGNGSYYVNGNWETTIGTGMPVEYDYYGIKYWGGMANPDLKWETTSQFNIGLDLALLKNRIRLTIDYYEKYTKDLLREKFITPSSGYDKLWVNDGELSNKGVEVLLSGDILRTEDLKLSGTLIFSKNENKVTSLGDAIQVGLQEDKNTGMLYEFWGADIAGNGFSQSYANILAVNQPINVYYGYTVNGIIQTEEEGLAAGLAEEGAMPGEFKYVDINNDGEIDTDDRQVIGDPNPDFLISFGLNAQYKNFDVEIFFSGAFGYDIFNMTKFTMPSDKPLRWTVDNPTNDYPSLRNGRNIRFSDYYIEDGSHLRLQNVNIGYNFSIPNLKFFSKGRVYLNASNLYTFTKFKGYDPEVGLNGVYGGGIPKLRRITLGIDVTF